MKQKIEESVVTNSQPETENAQVSASFNSNKIEDIINDKKEEGILKKTISYHDIETEAVIEEETISYHDIETEAVIEEETLSYHDSETKAVIEEKTISYHESETKAVMEEKTISYHDIETEAEIEENKNVDINELKENVPDENQFSDPKIVADCSTMTNISEKTEDESKEPNGESVDRKDVERSVDGDLGLDTVQDDWDDLDIVDQKASDVDKHTAFKKLK